MIGVLLASLKKSWQWLRQTGGGSCGCTSNNHNNEVTFIHGSCETLHTFDHADLIDLQGGLYNMACEFHPLYLSSSAQTAFRSRLAGFPAWSTIHRTKAYTSRYLSRYLLRALYFVALDCPRFGRWITSVLVGSHIPRHLQSVKNLSQPYLKSSLHHLLPAPMALIVISMVQSLWG
jgi:hypothetical protein